MIDRAAVADFLAQRRLAVAGVSADPKAFPTVVYRELRDRGYDVVAVNPHHETVAGDPCWPSLAAVPGPPPDGVVVMVKAPLASAVVDDAIAAGVPRVWLFRGIGQGARSEKAAARCVEAGVTLVDGACPFMFLEPVRNVHRLHRFVKRRAISRS